MSFMILTLRMKKGILVRSKKVFARTVYTSYYPVITGLSILSTEPFG